MTIATGLFAATALAVDPFANQRYALVVDKDAGIAMSARHITFRAICGCNQDN